MLKIWGRKNSINVQKVLWCCEELELPYTRIDAGGEFGRTAEPSYLDLNPTGRVPTLVDNGFALWESNVIVRYLAKRYGEPLLWPRGRKTQALADMWMDWQATSVWPHLRPAFIGLVRTPEAERDYASIRASTEASSEQLGILDAHLAGNRFVAGPSFSMGDIPLGALINRWFNLNIKRPALPYLHRWYERLSQRAAYKEIVTSIPLS